MTTYSLSFKVINKYPNGSKVPGIIPYPTTGYLKFNKNATNGFEDVSAKKIVEEAGADGKVIIIEEQNQTTFWLYN